MNLLDELKKENELDPRSVSIIKQIESKQGDFQNYSVRDGQLLYKSKYFIHHDSQIIRKILLEFHSSTLGGHSIVERTSKRITALFWWKGMSKRIKEFMDTCLICQ